MVKQLQPLFFTLQLSLLLILAACSSNPQQKESPSDSEAFGIAQQDALPHAQELANIFSLNSQNALEESLQAINQLQQQNLNTDELALLTAAQADRLNKLGHYPDALNIITHKRLNDQLTATNNHTQNQVNIIKAETLAYNQQYFDAAQLRIFLAPTLTQQQQYVENHEQIWRTLTLIPAEQVNSKLHSTHNSSLKQWLQLSLIIQHHSGSLDQQIALINDWQKRNPLHPAALIPLADIAALKVAAAQRPNKIAVILPFDGKYKQLANAIRDGLISAYYSSEHQPTISFYSLDSKQPFIDIYNATIDEGAELVVGPLFKNQLEELYQLDELPVPTISLNKLDKTLKPLNLIEYSLSSEDEIDSLVNLLNAQEKQQALVLYQQAQWAKDDKAHFESQWQLANNTVLKSSVFESNRDQSRAIQELLNIDKSKRRIRKLSSITATKLESEPRRRQDADFILVLAKPKQAASIRPMLKFHYAGDLPAYANSRVYPGYSDPSRDRDLQGITLTDIPWAINPPADIASNYNKSSLLRMVAFGYDAFQLSERITLMQSNQNASLNGATGVLHIEDNQLIRRTLFAKFSSGIAKPLSLPSNTDS